MEKRLIIPLSLTVLFASFFTPTQDAHFFWERLPFFNSLFGFFGCVILILGCKFLGKKLIQRDVEPYD